MVFGIICVIQAVCLYMSNVHIMDQNGPWIFIRDVLISVLNIFLLLCSFFCFFLTNRGKTDFTSSLHDLITLSTRYFLLKKVKMI